MSPLEIGLLLHYHTTPVPHPMAGHPMHEHATESFRANGLIEQRDDDCWHTTERGHAHVAQLCALPWPRSRYVDQNGDIIVVAKGESHETDEA